MIYRIGVYDYVSGKIVFEYKFIKNPNNIKYDRKHIMFTNEVIAGWLNYEWGLEQQKLTINVNMPFIQGYKANPQEDAMYFKKQMEYVIDSKRERWFFGKKGEMYIGFITNFSFDKKADNPNFVGFNIGFLVDEYYKDYSIIIQNLSEVMFKGWSFDTIQDYKTRVLNLVRGKIR